MRARAALLAAALLGCATRPPPPPSTRPRERPAPRAARERPEFLCQGPERPLLPGPHHVTTADGPSRLSVTLAAPRARGESVSRARVRVVALQATTGALGVELARAVGANVWVAPDVAPARVTFAGVYTVEALALVLRNADVALEVTEDGAIALGEWSVRAHFNRGEFERRRQVRESRASQMLEAVETRLFPVSERTNAASLARYFCRRLASERGAAAVFRRWIAVSDTPDRLNRFERLLRDVDRADAPRP